MSYASAARPPFAMAFGPRPGHPPVARVLGLALAMKAMHRHTHGSDGHHGHPGFSRSQAQTSADESTDPRMTMRGGPSGGRGSWGPFPSFRPPFGGSGHGGGPFPFGPPSGGAPKARRGDVRTAILAVLADGPRNGYQVIGEIAERSGGAWRPSPGSIYPTLSQLEDEDLVKADEPSGRRRYDLTESGRTYVAEHPDEMAAPWESFKEAAPDEWHETFGVFKQVAAATWQVMHTGTDAQRTDARRILADARRHLYRVLGEDSAAEDGTDEGVAGHEGDDDPR